MANKSNPKIKKYKLKKCIRKNTYRFVFEEDELTRAWAVLKSEYGEDTFIKGFEAYQIENDVFILRAFISTNTLSLIAKNKFNEDEENKFYKLIGYSEEA